MPTPVNHLIMAKETVEKEPLHPSIRRLLQRERGPFLFGHTAPDVQTVNGRRRCETHFYTIPPCGNVSAYRALLTAYPELALPDRLTPSHAAFLAGYLAHLLVDEMWWREIFHPHFGPQVEWATWEERLFLHNVLRTWLDLQDQARLEGWEADTLAAVEPEGWLPFVSDEDLRAWRDLLVEQLRPGRTIRTAEVFAERMHLSAETVKRALHSPEQMARIFRHVPPVGLKTYRAKALRRSAELLNEYLAPMTLDIRHPT